jgi:hypothetical protein
MIRLLHSILIPAVVCVPGRAQKSSLPVVMVADLAGKVLRGGGQSLTLAEGIPAQRALRLEAGARLVVIHLKTGEELVFTGPGTVSFDAEGHSVGTKPSRRQQITTLGEGLRLEPGAWAQASVVLRKEVIPADFNLEQEEPMPFNPESNEAGQGVWLHPRGTAILGNRPEFRWRLPIPGLTARLHLMDASGAQVFDGVVPGEVLTLTAETTLRFGADYRWRLVWTLPDGQERRAEGEFRVLPEAEAHLIQGLRPSQDASFPERLAFAVALESRGLLDEARPYWMRLAAERPGDATLRHLAGP